MSRRPTGPTGREAFSEITTRLGSLMSEVKTAFEQGQAAQAGAGENAGENTREFSIDTPAGPLKGMASFRVGTLADRAGASSSRDASQHEVKRKASSRSTAQPPAEMADAREPLVDLFDEADEILIVAELPGVKPEEVTVTVGESAVIITTTGARRFRAVQVLPCAVDEASLTRAMRNGILEVRLTKIGAAA